MAFGINILNTPAEIKKLPIQEPLQQAGINKQFEQGMQNYNPDMVDQYAQQKFQRDIVPAIAESFTRTGTSQRSSAFQGALGAGASDLSSRLAGMRYEAGLNQLKIGLTPQNEYLYQPEKAGLAQQGLQNFVGALADKAPDLIEKGIEAWGNRGKNQQSQTTQVTPTGQTTSQQAASTTEQALNGLTPPRQPQTAADLVPQSTGNMAIDAFNNPSLTPFARQALEKTKIQQPSGTTNAVQQIGQKPSIGSRIGNALGNTAMTTATTVPLVLSAVAAGAPAAIAIAGGLALGGWNLFNSLRGK